jgi:hypothetical protein
MFKVKNGKYLFKKLRCVFNFQRRAWQRYSAEFTGERVSLETKDRGEADRLVFHKNEAQKNTSINHRIGMNYFSASDPDFATRTWRFVMEDIVKDKQGSTLERYQRALKDSAYDLIVDKLLVETLPRHMLAVLRAGGTATNVYSRRLQNHAYELDWLHKRILAKKLFPKIKHKETRGITQREHGLIIVRENNPERRDYYELLWHRRFAIGRCPARQ